MNIRKIQADRIREFYYAVLDKIEVREDVARHCVEGIVQASLRGIDSHGIRLFPHYVQGFEKGRLNKNPEFRFTRTSPCTGKLDGDHTQGHAAGAQGMFKAIEIAEESGIGAVAVYNSSHFGVAAYYAFMAAEKDMIGLSFTHATAHVLSYGGTRPFFGNNPVCMVAPCEGEDPFCLDMATTVTTFNEVQQYKEQGRPIPIGWGVDENGKNTNDPSRVESLLPIGSYKGFGLSMMVEILCSLLAGMPYGPHVSPMFGNSMDAKRLLGHFFMAIRINCFEDSMHFKRRLKQMMDSLRNEPRFKEDIPVLVPGDPEKEFFEERFKAGIPVPSNLRNQLSDLANQYKVKFPV